MLKGYRLTLFYLVLTLGTHLLYRTLNFKGSITVVVVITLMFAGFSFGKVFWSKDSNTKLTYALTALLFATIAAKVDYTYHNKLISFSLFFVSIYFVVKREFTPLFRRKIISISILTLGLVLVPDKQILAYTYNRLLTNGEQVSWEDFKSTPNREKGNSARIRANLFYKISKVYDYPPGIVLSYVEPYESWVKNKTDEPSFNLLLAHEQGHFYISEYCARLANDSMRSTWANEKKTESIINAFYSKMNSLQASYDSITNHGVEVAIQFVWTKDIKKKLGIPSLPTDIENIPYKLNRDTTNTRY